MKKNILVALCLFTLVSCGGRTGPDESMVILSSNSLLLPPEYELLAPEDVVYARTKEENVEIKSKKILLGGSSEVASAEENSWVLKKAGGEKRIKNIKEILDEDLAKEEAENE